MKKSVYPSACVAILAMASLSWFGWICWRPVYASTLKLISEDSTKIVNGIGLSTTTTQIWLKVRERNVSPCVKCGNSYPDQECPDLEVFNEDGSTAFRGCRRCLLEQLNSSTKPQDTSIPPKPLLLSSYGLMYTCSECCGSRERLFVPGGDGPATTFDGVSPNHGEWRYPEADMRCTNCGGRGWTTR